jgi:hypothetical protein
MINWSFVKNMKISSVEAIVGLAVWTDSVGPAAAEITYITGKLNVRSHSRESEIRLYPQLSPHHPVDNPIVAVGQCPAHQ